METVYVVQHVHITPSGEADTKFIGVYRTVDSAKAAVSRLNTQPGFIEYPHVVNPETDGDEQGFYIDQYRLDKDHWAEGYVTL